MDEGLLNDLLECSVCLERLDTSSRVLPCQHTFCLKCLKVIVESHKELRCPECRILVDVKVEELPPNVLLMRILEGMKNAPRKSGPSQRGQRAGHLQTQIQQGGQVARTDGKQLPPHGRAIYDFISKEPGDLSFKKGETILLQKKLDAFWYQGESSGRTGMFPITYVQVVIPLPVPTALCKALYDFRMSAPDEEGCLAFDKGAIITVHRRVDENWAEGKLEQRVGIFPIAFVELNQPARQLMNSTPLNRPVPPLPEHTRAGHSDHRHHTQHSHRYQQMSMSTPLTAQGNYQNMATMSQSHPNYGQPLPSQILIPQPVNQQITVSHGGLVTTTAVPRNIVEPTQTKHTLDLIHFNNMHIKNQGTMGLQSVSRIPESYDRLRVKYDSYNATPVPKMETTYQNVRTHEHFPVSVANFNANNLSSDSSSSMNTPSLGVSSTTTPNTSSCESAEPSLPSSPDNNTEPNPTVVASNQEETNEQESLNTSMGVLSLNESSTATNTSLNVSLPSESPKLNVSAASSSSQNQGESQEIAINNEPSRLDTPSSSKNVLRSSGPDSLLTFGLGLQAALSPSHAKDGGYMVPRSHRDHHHNRDKRHSLTPSSHLQGNHTQNRHSAEILATSLLDHAPERERSRPERERDKPERDRDRPERERDRPERDRDRPERERERRRRRSRSDERPLPAPYIALYPYKPQKSDELELKKGAVYMVTERCRDGWYKGTSERSQRGGVFPGNYVAPAPLPAAAAAPTPTPTPAPSAAPTAATHSTRTKHDKSGVGSAGSKQSPAGPPPAAPPRAPSPLTLGQSLHAQPLTYQWSPQSQQQQITPRSEKSKEKSKAEKSSISTGVSLMKRLAAMKKCKSPPPVGYSMDNPVFEDGPGTSLMLNLAAQHHPVHVRSGSCPSQLLRALPASERLRHKERPALAAVLHDHHHHLRASDGPWQSQHRKSQSLDVTATRRDRERDRHHSQLVKERFRCIVPYPPNSEYELELKVDDIVIVSKKRGDGWYKGTLQRTGRTGLFPASFVQSCPQE
ncbi:E3 ubiquitin-protein ligase SH3RF1 [Achroia grisella]|uniref:E3 ubiquitin-protein ligase SH3RF1 n=1 Tax=Achroia grisella TaxID=688607 RepID=UPI0027D26B2F|nr:E3 ubiquitin-protein ligase SH3RF1 [Achroia grisella]